MNDDQLNRYSRHILLNEIGIEGQQAIGAARVLVIGVGGLGSPAAMYLAAAGVGTLILCDDDVVELSNLQRQVLHSGEMLGQPKAVSARLALARLNPEIETEVHVARLMGETLEEEIARADVVLDCSDNFATRHAVSRACVRQRKPLVSGAAIRFDGQVAVFDRRSPESPCYHCLFPEAQSVEELRCAVTGVFAPLTGMVGCMQAGEALKLIGGFGTTLSGRLLLLDALTMQWRTIRFVRDPQCAVCSA